MAEDLQSITEDELVSHIQEWVTPASSETCSIGDDCAVLKDGTLLKTDCVVEGMHYLPETSAFLVGRKAVGRVISDFAAMGGAPVSLLVTIGLRKKTPLSYVRELYRGLDSMSVDHGARIIGGETTVVPEQSAHFISISGTGEMRGRAPILRSGAKKGDLIYVTGRLGGSFLSERHLTFSPRLKEAAWLMEFARPSAMMDLSDGVAKDLPRLSASSAVGYEIDYKAIPKHNEASIENALSDGEDYELLFTLPPERATLLKEAPFLVSCIGQMCMDTPKPLLGGWDHFTGV